MVLDDDVALVDVTVETLRKAGFQASGTSNPQEALKSVASGKAGVIVSDIQMPLMDGFQFLENALQVESIRVILVTGHYSLDSAIEAIKRGAYDYLPKPLDYPRLLKTLDELVASQRRNQIHELEDRLLTNPEFEESWEEAPRYSKPST